MELKTTIPKSEARKQVTLRREELSESELIRKTHLILDNLTSLEDYKFADTVHCYISSRPGEVETRLLIDKMVSGGKTVILPKLNALTGSFRRFPFTSWDDIIVNDEGYCEPKQGIDGSLNDVDLIIVPSLAISRNGFRVGYGGGYYDRLLREVYCKKIVLAYEFQVFNSIEAHPHDCRVDRIVTERRVIETLSTLHGFSSN